MNSEILVEFFYIIKRRWYFMIIFAVFCSAGLLIEKTYFSPAIPQTGSMMFTQVVKFDQPVKKYSEGENIKDVTMIYNVHMYSNLQKFLDESESIFNYEKLERGWNNKTISEKFNWLNKHLEVHYCGSNVYEFILRFGSEDPKEATYVEKNGDNFLTNYVNYSKNVSTEIIGECQITILDKYQLFNKRENVTQTDILIKFGIIGFVLGIIISCVVLFLVTLHKKYNEVK